MEPSKKTYRISQVYLPCGLINQERLTKEYTGSAVKGLPASIPFEDRILRLNEDKVDEFTDPCGITIRGVVNYYDEQTETVIYVKRGKPRSYDVTRLQYQMLVKNCNQGEIHYEDTGEIIKVTSMRSSYQIEADVKVLEEGIPVKSEYCDGCDLRKEKKCPAFFGKHEMATELMQTQVELEALSKSSDDLWDEHCKKIDDDRKTKDKQVKKMRGGVEKLKRLIYLSDYGEVAVAPKMEWVGNDKADTASLTPEDNADLFDFEFDIDKAKETLKRSESPEHWKPNPKLNMEKVRKAFPEWFTETDTGGKVTVRLNKLKEEKGGQEIESSKVG